MPAHGPMGARVVPWLTFSWGVCTFFPVGIAYVHMLLLLFFLASDARQRLPRLRQRDILFPMVAFLGWTLIALPFGPWFDDAPVRLFHIVRVLLLLAMGMMLTRIEATMAIRGILVGAVVAALIVAVHHVWGLPPWTIWASLLKSRKNFSSGNMIMMAIAAGLFFYLGLRNDQKWLDRWVAWLAALALAITVAAHALSRNAQILLPILFGISMLCHFRTWRASLISMGLVAAMALVALQWSPTTQTRFHELVQESRRVASASDYTTSVGERWRMHEEAVRAMITHPVFGTGLGSWSPRWRVAAHESMGTLPPELRADHIEINNPHNDFLLTGMETGVPGLLGMIWMLGAFLMAGWRRRSSAGGVTVVLTVSVIVTALVNAPLRDAALGMTLLWLLGASVARHQDEAHA